MRTLLTQASYLLLLLLFVFLASVNLPNLFDSTQSGKFVVFGYVILAIAGFRVMAALNSSDCFSVRVNVIDLLLLCFVSYVTINRYLLQPLHGFSFRYYELLGLSVLYVVVRRLNGRIYLYLCLALIFSGMIQAVYGNMQLYGLFQSFNGNFRMTGSFFNPGPYSGYLICVFPVSLYVQLYQGDCLRTVNLDQGLSSDEYRGALKYLRSVSLRILIKHLPVVAIITTLLVLPASHSRAAWLAVVVSSLFLISTKYRLHNKISSFFNSFSGKASLVVLAVLLVAASVIGLYHMRQDSANGRLLIWKSSVKMIFDRPLLGFGYDRWKAHYMNYQADYFRDDLHTANETLLADNVYYAFNEYLQNFAENGLFGLFIILLTIAFCFTARSAVEPKLLILAKAFLISLGTFAFYSYPMQILPIKIASVLMLAIVASSGNFRTLVRFDIVMRLIPRWSARIMSACLVVAFLLALRHVQGIRHALESWNKAFTFYQGGDYMESLHYYQEAAAILKTDGDFMMHFGKALSMARQPENAIAALTDAAHHLNTTIIHTTLGDCYKAIGSYTNAEDSYWQAWYMTPGRFYPKYLLAKLYHETHENEKAQRIAKELLLKEAKIESTAIKQMRYEMEKILAQNENQNP